MTTYSEKKQNIANDHGSVTFKCPRCGERNITRSRHERAIVAKYECTCGMVGPN